ncbi:MAG: hypothetical protein H3C53_09045 [Trueperaceae bacterium]|nr:hypothetical protein [Trueperaceae bacterium]
MPRNLGTTLRTALATLALVLAATALAQSWTPYELKGPAYFRFVTTENGGPELGYSVDIRASSVVDEEGAPLFEVTTTRTSYQPLENALMGDMMGLMTGFTSMYLMMLVPALADMDMVAGERMSLFGAGRVTVLGQETHGGRTGHHLLLESKNSEDEYERAFEWVIDFDLPLPIATRYYEEGELTREERLVEYHAN